MCNTQEGPASCSSSWASRGGKTSKRRLAVLEIYSQRRCLHHGSHPQMWSASRRRGAFQDIPNSTSMCYCMCSIWMCCSGCLETLIRVRRSDKCTTGMRKIWVHSVLAYRGCQKGLYSSYAYRLLSFINTCTAVLLCTASVDKIELMMYNRSVHG